MVSERPVPRAGRSKGGEVSWKQALKNAMTGGYRRKVSLSIIPTCESTPKEYWKSQTFKIFSTCNQLEFADLIGINVVHHPSIFPVLQHEHQHNHWTKLSTIICLCSPPKSTTLSKILSYDEVQILQILTSSQATGIFPEFTRLVPPAQQAQWNHTCGDWTDSVSWFLKSGKQQLAWISYSRLAFSRSTEKAKHIRQEGMRQLKKSNDKARRGAAMKKLKKSNDKARRVVRGLEGESEISAAGKALISLPRLDIAVRGKECVLLLFTEESDDDLSWPPVLAWYPEEQLVGIVSNRLLPRDFIPMASCSGLLCGFHREDVLSDWLPGWPPCPLRVAVCNPRTGFQLELPVLNVSDSANDPASAHRLGQIKLEMRGNQEQFSIHVLCTARGVHTVYTWHSSSQVWGSSTSAKAWNDFPLPQGFEGYSYHRVDPFRYTHKVIVVGQCENKLPGGIVLLELEGGGGGPPVWRPVAWATADQFADFGTPPPAYLVDWPLQGGDLVVMRAATCSMLDKPVALHLKHHNWLELPASVCRLNLQAVCVYNP
ncbi:hypothetical protein SELMODRAFT_408647 [Selaginella moellendorffii]|uniref:Uncharacterized protein n=1 Tax=Selaginella moellendorffii TaxID=88036 RepID=D8R9H6_SELML|nr:hypothetical protein SELMODRAFT_408647 [Selaginella moellendorffii]